MGLSIHWEWHARISRDEAGARIRALYERAAELPFDHCFEPVEIDWAQPPASSDEMLIRQWAGYALSLEERENESVGRMVDPLWSISFFATDKGSELAFFGYAQYPDSVKYKGRDVPTGVSDGLHWQRAYKTHYASLPDEGGDQNFLRAHKNVIAVLDAAVELGFEPFVLDEGDYWEKRDEAVLLDKLRQLDRYLAAFAGKLKDALGNDGVEGPILGHPEFERLEAAGATELGDKLGQGLEAVRDSLQRTDPKHPAHE